MATALDHGAKALAPAKVEALAGETNRGAMTRNKGKGAAADKEKAKVAAGGKDREVARGKDAIENQP